ncbi:unnamed protein product [Trifolium pratense]|uniref:Uncharacterized protein n=2 Tax=Trifolium pratense TaxID=57577 RepID=A0ACB0JNF9_TRIPR|nr:unnamed protein product [Trifolium pratense]CAJ2646639.1 unnamed protein product [Trifolium pratense]
MFISGTKVSPLKLYLTCLYVDSNLKKITEIISRNFRQDLLIGDVHELRSPQTTMGGKLKFPFTIKDLSANVVDCCLWDSLAAHFIDYLKIRTDSGPIVVIVKHAHLKLAENNYPLQVTNAWNGTFLLINDDIPPINDFKNRLPADNTFAIQSNIIQSSDQMISQSSFSGSNRS